MYECVLALLRDIQMGTESNETLDSRTIVLVQDLCQRLDRLIIERIRTQIDEEAECTTVIGVSEAQDYTLASLTSSDVANSVADLARHFINMTDLLTPDPQTSKASGGNQDSVRLSKSTVKMLGPDQRGNIRIAQSESSNQPKSVKTHTPVHQLSLPVIDLGSTHPIGRTYPSAMLDALNMSGGGQPWKVS
ncbi:hypothetical protein LTR54_017428 [Friedmanniomyces endolithicus]|nr:hypothetical protein LTR54_017428 [Friedmanniomyces endolithicus]